MTCGINYGRANGEHRRTLTITNLKKWLLIWNYIMCIDDVNIPKQEIHLFRSICRRIDEEGLWWTNVLIACPLRLTSFLTVIGIPLRLKVLIELFPAIKGPMTKT